MPHLQHTTCTDFVTYGKKRVGSIEMYRFPSDINYYALFPSQVFQSKLLKPLNKYAWSFTQFLRVCVSLGFYLVFCVF